MTIKATEISKDYDLQPIGTAILRQALEDAVDGDFFEQIGARLWLILDYPAWRDAFDWPIEHGLDLLKDDIMANVRQWMRKYDH